MKTYKRHRTPEELKAACKAAGLKYSQAKFDRGDSDYITFDFKHGKATLHVCMSTFNGRAFGELEGVKGHSWFSTSSTEDERKHWFQALLAFIYTNEPAPTNVRRKRATV
jgi:hypothetical protein